MQLSQLFLEYAQHTQPEVALWISHPPLEYTHHALPPLLQLWLPHLSLENAHHARPSTSCGYVASHQSQEYAHHTQPVVAMWLSHPSLEYAHHARLCQLWLRGYLTDPWNTHTTPSQVWLCGYLTHPWSTPTSLPLPTVATWLSHLSLEYAHHAQPGVAISPIHGVRPPSPPLCQLWLRGYLTYPWSTHTTPSQVWPCGYLTYPWSAPTTPTSLPLPAVATWLSHLSLEYAHHAQPSVAMWLSHPSLEYAHHAHLSASASFGYVAISLIPGSCPPRQPFYQLWLRGFSSIPGVRTPHPARCAYLTYSWSTPSTPTLCQLWLCGYLTYPWSMPTTPTLLSTSNAPSHLPGVATRLSPLPLEYARHAHPLSAAATQLSHISLKYTHPIASCGYTTSHLALEYTHHAQPAAGVVAMWPSHFSSAGIQRLATLPPEYALHTQPFHQLWLPYPIPPPFPNPGVQQSPSPHAQPLRQLCYVAFSLLSRMSITRSTPTMPKLIHQLWLHNHLPYFPQDMPITPMQLTR